MEVPKRPPSERLEQRVQKADEIFGVRLAPRDWRGMSRHQLESNYKVRYQQYIKLLRGMRTGEDPTVDEKARLLVTGLNNIEAFIQGHTEGTQDILRGKRQVSVFEDLHNFLERGNTEGYIKLPTGVGKTVIFLKLIEALGLKTLIVVPSKVLVGQTGEKMEEFTDTEFGKVFSDSKDYSKPVTITTYHSLINGVRNGSIDPNQFPVLILDEAHRSLTEERMNAIKLFNGVKVGFTATPRYSKAKSLDKLLGTEIHSMHLHEAIEEGLLCETHTIHAHTDVDLSGISIKSGEYDQKELEKLINIHTRNRAALELYKKGFSNDKVVCYCSTVRHAEALQELFDEDHIPCAVITAETTKDDRTKIFEQFRSGATKVLLNVKVLIEGFDEPSCNVAFNLHPTLSIIDAEQRGGRPLRLDKDNPKKVAYIVDFIDRNRANPSVLFSEILGGAARACLETPFCGVLLRYHMGIPV